MPVATIKVGFTGTRSGMSRDQKQQLGFLLGAKVTCLFAHGDCIGADEEASEIADSLGIPIAIYPPSNPKYRAWCKPKNLWFMADPEDYDKRNRAIVDNSDVIVAAPRNEKIEELRSGTWAAIRYAKKVKKNVVMLARTWD